ncbi:MAG: trypsin-like serine peptidase [Elusimicrobiales bacterium]
MRKNVLVSLFLAVIVFWIFWGIKTEFKRRDFRNAPKDDFGYIDLNKIRGNSNNLPLPKATFDNSIQQPTIQDVAVYGKNTIMDYYAVKRSLQELSHSVPALVRKSSLLFDEKRQKYIAVTKVLKESSYLADDEDFSDQLQLAFCSASLVGKRLILTAGHCIDNNSYKDVYVVFGWRQTGKGQYNLEFSEDDVYEIERIIVRKLSDEFIGYEDIYEDYALALLKRAVKGVQELSIDRDGSFVVKDREVFTIGYPKGMSVKITDPKDAKIYIVGKTQFNTDLDAFGGNSGSPVFDSYTKRIIGILVSGDSEQVRYILNRDIQISYEIEENMNSKIKKITRKDGTIVFIVSNEFYRYLQKISARKKIIIDEINKTITFQKGGEYFDSDLASLIVWITGNVDALEKGRLVRRASYYHGSGTGVQKINSLLESLIPLSSEEKAICNSIRNQIEINRPVINPELIMFYKMNRCDKEIGI